MSIALSRVGSIVGSVNGLAAAGILAVLVSLVSCGPAIIGLNLPDDPTVKIENARASKITPSTTDRPGSGNETRLRFRIAHPSSKPVWFRLEYRVGTGTVMPIRDGDIRRLDPQDPTRGEPFPFGLGGDRWVGQPTSPADGQIFDLAWDHSAAIGRDIPALSGQAEIRNITVVLRYGANSELNRSLEPIELFGNQTLGQQYGELRDLQLNQVGGAEGQLELKAEYADFGADGRETLFAIDYSIDGGSSWVPIRDPGDSRLTPGVTIGVSSTPVSAAMPGVSQVTYSLDPLAPELGIPLADYADFRMRIAASVEVLASSYRTSATLRTPSPVEISKRVVIGDPATITAVDIPSPDDRGPSGSENHVKPWLRVPVRMRLVNQSRSNRPVVVQISGRYQVDGLPTVESAPPMTLLDEPGFEPRVTLDPGEQKVIYVLWDVATDEGLGAQFGDGFPAKVALVHMRTEFVPTAGVGRVLAAPYFQPAPDTTLFTAPFVNFTQLLRRNGTTDVLDATSLVGARRIESSQTLDLFHIQRPMAGAQASVLGTDQQFAPLPIPSPASQPFFDSSGQPAFVSWILPTDLAPGVPDCLVSTRTGLFFSEWDRAGNVLAPVRQPGRTPRGNQLGNRGLRSSRIALRGPSGPAVEAALRFQFDRRTVNGIRYVTPQPNVYVPDPATRLWDHSFPATPIERPLPAGVPSGLQGVLGEFDGDSGSVDYVVAVPGSEADQSGPTGWFDVLSMRLDAGGAVVFAAPVPIPRPPLLAGNPNPRPQALSSWYLRRWPTEDPERPGLVLVRRWLGDDSYNLEYSVHVIDQAASGGFANQTWRPLTWSPFVDRCAARTDPNLQGILCARQIPGVGRNPFIRGCMAEDLDSDGDPELLLIFGENDTASDRFTVMLLSERRSKPAVWRPLFSGLEATSLNEGGTTFSKFDIEDTELIDLNGDDLLDLLVHVTRPPSGTGPEGGWVYYSSSLSGVGGDLGPIPPLASNSPSVLPAIADLDGDGYQDILSSGTVHFGRPDGGYEGRVGIGLTTSFVTTASRLSRMLGSVDNKIDLILFDRDRPDLREVNRVVTLGQVGTRAVAVETQRDLILPLARAVVSARSIAPDGWIPGAELEIAAVLEPTGAPLAPKELWRFRRSGDRYVPVGLAPWETALAAMGGRGDGLLATVQRGRLTEPVDILVPQHSQDVAVAKSGPSRVVVLDSTNGYDPVEISLGAGAGTIEALSSAEVNGDQFEDLLVLTRSAQTFRVFRVLQDPVAGFAGRTAEKFLEFDEPNGGSNSLIGFGFARNRAALGQGLVLTRSQMRFILPRAGRVPAVVRSDTPDVPLAPLRLVFADTDNDGQVDVFAGQVDGGRADLLKIERATRR